MNTHAATESEIANLSMRLAGMADSLGMSEADTLALAASMTELGIRAEAGGSAMSTMMSVAASEIQRGTELGQKWADTMGVGIEEAARIMEEDAYGALVMMVEGLEEVEASGGNVDQAMRDLGVTNIRQIDVLKRLLGSSDDLTESQKQANAEWERNSALIEESAQRYETFESEMRMLKNSIDNIFSNFGNAFIQANDGIIGAISDTIVEIDRWTDSFFDAEGGLTDVGQAAVETAQDILAITVPLGIMGAAFFAFGPGGAVTAAVVMGLGAIGIEVGKLADEMGEGSALEKAIRNFIHGAPDSTGGMATNYVKAKDEILDTVSELRQGIADEAGKTKEEVIDEVEDLQGQIQLALDEEYQQTKGVIEGLMQDATEPQKAMLESHLESLEAAYQVGTEQISNASGDLVRILGNAYEDNRKISAREFDQIISNFNELDEVFATSATDNATQLKRLSSEFEGFNENTTFKTVQTNLTEFAQQSAEMMGELNKAFEENKEVIENSTLSDQEKAGALAVLEAQHLETEEAVLQNLKAYETEAQMLEENVDATEGLTDAQKSLLGITDQVTEASYLYNSGMDSSVYSAENKKNAIETLDESIKDHAKRLEDSKNTADSFAEAYAGMEGPLSTIPHMMGAISESSEEIGYDLGLGFASRLEDGVGYVDLGTSGEMKVDEFVSAVRNGELSVEEVGVAQVNAMRAGIGMETLTPEGENKMLEFVSGFDGKSDDLTGIIDALGADMLIGMEVDLGPAGQVNMETFAAGLASGEYGIVEVMAFYQTMLEEKSDVDLTRVGEDTINSLQIGLDNGFIEAEQIANTFADTLPASLEIDMEQEGIDSIQTLVDGFNAGEVDVDTFFEGLKQGIENLEHADLTSFAGDTVDTGIEGLNNKKPAVEEAARDTLKTPLEETTDVDLSTQGGNTAQSFVDGIIGRHESVNEASETMKRVTEFNLGSTTDGDGGQKAGGFMETGLLYSTEGIINAANTAKTSAETPLSTTTDGGGGENAGSSMWEGIQNWWSPTASAAEMTSSTVETTMGSTTDGGGGTSSGGMLQSGILGQVGNVRSASNSAKNAVESTMGSTTDNDGGTSAGGMLASGILGQLGNVRGASDSNKSEVENTLGSTTDGEGGASSTQMFTDAISASLMRAFRVAESVSNAVIDVLGATTDGGGGNKAGSLFVSGISGQAGPASSAGSNVSSSARSGLNRNTNTYGLGQNFGSGFVRGIRSYVGAAVSAAASLARAALNAVKRQQRSSSPSKETMKLGGDFGDGFALAVDNSAKKASDSARRMVRGAMDAIHSENSRNDLALDMGANPSVGRRMQNDIKHSITTSGMVDVSNRQPAHINVNVGGQEFETFSDNIYESSTRRLDFRNNYDV